jgi:hypothetical protein
MRTLKIAAAALIYAAVVTHVQADDHASSGSIVDVAERPVASRPF